MPSLSGGIIAIRFHMVTEEVSVASLMDNLDYLRIKHESSLSMIWTHHSVRCHSFARRI
jgi:hypothetical protein